MSSTIIKMVVLDVKIEEGADFYIQINDRGQDSPENINLPEIYIHLLGMRVGLPHVI